MKNNFYTSFTRILMYSIVIMVILVSLISACKPIEKETSKYFLYTKCIHGVEYALWKNAQGVGMTVLYNQDSTVRICKEGEQNEDF